MMHSEDLWLQHVVVQYIETPFLLCFNLVVFYFNIKLIHIALCNLCSYYVQLRLLIIEDADQSKQSVFCWFKEKSRKYE